jgi:hypothetical protein
MAMFDDPYQGKIDMAKSGNDLQAGRKHNPLFNDNKLKLGLFGVNVSNGCAITTVEERHNRLRMVHSRARDVRRAADGT